MFEGMPGPELAALLAGADPERVSDAELLDGVAAWERLASWVSASAASWQLRAERRLGDEIFPDAGELQMATRIRISVRSMGNRLDFAQTLDRLPPVAKALAAGEIGWGHASTFGLELAGVPGPVAAAIAEETMDRARRCTPGRLTRILRRAVLRVTPAVIAPTEFIPEPWQPQPRFWTDRSLGLLHAELDQVTLASIEAAVEAHAGRSGPEDGRSVEERRADAFVELILQRPDGSPRVAATVQVVVGADTLFGSSREPGDLGGFGPIGAETTEQVACTAGWFSRLLVDPVDGKLLDLGRSRRDPDLRLRGYVAARDGTCRFPGCARAATSCEPHHMRWWARGGATSRDNLVSLCGRHHAAVHLGGWKLRGGAEATLTWTSPTGQDYRSDPHDFHRRT